MANVVMLEELLATAALVIVECTKVRWYSEFRLCPILLLTLNDLFATTGLFTFEPIVGEEGLALVATFMLDLKMGSETKIRVVFLGHAPRVPSKNSERR